MRMNLFLSARKNLAIFPHTHAYTPLHAHELVFISQEESGNFSTHTHAYTPLHAHELVFISHEESGNFSTHTHTDTPHATTDPERQFSLLLRHIEMIRSKVQWMRSRITVYVEHNLGFEV
jgi:hypothetical protein